MSSQPMQQMSSQLMQQMSSQPMQQMSSQPMQQMSSQPMQQMSSPRASKMTRKLGASTQSRVRDPLLHEDKMPGFVASGSMQEGLRHEPKLSLPHEVKLYVSSGQDPDLHWTDLWTNFGGLNLSTPVLSLYPASILNVLPLLLLLQVVTINSSSSSYNIASKPSLKLFFLLLPPSRSWHNSCTS